MMERSNLIDWIEKLPEAHVLVIGDVMLDRFVYGEISRISPEAPVPVLRYGETKSSLGGVGNVVRNLLALGSHVYFVSVVGDDPEGEEIKTILRSLGGIDLNLIVELRRETTVKTRFIAARQQVLRLDRETTRSIQSASQEKSLQAIQEFMDSCAVVVLSDYGKGFLCKEMPSLIIEAAKKSGKPVFVDPKGTDFTRYRGASVLTPNAKELSEATNLKVDGDEAVVAAAKRLIDACELSAVLATRSQEGMSLVQASGEVTHLKTEAKEVFDVSGAGDTVIAVLSAAFGAGAPLPEASRLANIAAGVVVGKVGTAVTYKKDLIQALHHQELSSAEAKVLDLDTAVDRVELWRRMGKRIGFTNGVFDLLHPGHLSLLTQAAKICDRLIVGLNGDISVRRLKGEEPMQHESARSAILASLEAVDIVLIFQEDTPFRLLDVLRPDVLIKGANYKPEEVVGADLVRSYGGEVILADIAASLSPTIAKMAKGTL